MSRNEQMTEAELLRALARSDSLEEQRALVGELEDLRQQRREDVQASRDTDLANSIIRDTLTPVRVHEAHTEATDWIQEIPTSGDEYHHAMRSKAIMWAKGLHPAVLEDRDEFAAQAMGMARREAGKYGEEAEAAARTFLDEAARYHRQAADNPGEVDEDQSGNAESTVTDYDTMGEESDPMFSEDWTEPTLTGEDGYHPETASDTSSFEEDVVTTETDEQGVTSRRRRKSQQIREQVKRRKIASDYGKWYDHGYDHGLSEAQQGISIDDAPDPLSGEWAGESIPEIFGSWEAATEEAMDGYEAGYWDALAGSPRQAQYGSKKRRQVRRKRAATMVNDADLAPLEAEWEAAFQALKDAGLEADADHPIAARYRAASDAVNHAHRSRDFAIMTGQPTARREATRKTAEGETCAVCGDSIARDPEGEEPRTWHHTSGGSHDHEAEPKSENGNGNGEKESRRKQAALPEFEEGNQVLIDGDEVTTVVQDDGEEDVEVEDPDEFGAMPIRIERDRLTLAKRRKRAAPQRPRRLQRQPRKGDLVKAAGLDGEYVGHVFLGKMAPPGQVWVEIDGNPTLFGENEVFRHRAKRQVETARRKNI